MAVKQDCPKCGRKGNEGSLVKDDSDKTLEAIDTVGGTLLGFVLGGPVGAVAGAALLNKLANHAIKGQDYLTYRFYCMNPECKHSWTTRIKQ